MKKLLIGLVVVGSTFSGYAQSCGQTASLIKAKSEVGKVVRALNPINSALLDNSGEIKDVFYDFRSSSFISERFNESIDEFDDNKANVEDLGGDLTRYVSKSLKECIKADELLQIVDSLEKISTSAPHYKAFLKRIAEELTAQRSYVNVISQDIQKVESGEATNDEISTFLERYMGANLEIALYHANSYLVEIKKNTSSLIDLTEKLNTRDIDENFTKAETSIAVAIEITFEAIELSGV